MTHLDDVISWMVFIDKWWWWWWWTNEL